MVFLSVEKNTSSTWNVWKIIFYFYRHVYILWDWYINFFIDKAVILIAEVAAVDFSSRGSKFLEEAKQ